MNDQARQPIDPPVDAIIMAAGKGTRMNSELPKVLLDVHGKPMVQWVVDACLAAGCDRVIVVIGFKGDQVKAALCSYDQCYFVEQTQQLGTGHAVMMAKDLFDPSAGRDVFVLGGDGPLIRAQTLDQLLQVHRDGTFPATLATAVIDDPTGYGRVIRDSDNTFKAIVEQKDATAEQLAVHEVNPSYYCFKSDALFAKLSQIKPNNQQGEYYLTDVPGILKSEGNAVGVVDAVPKDDVLSINTREQLAEVDRILQSRMAQK
ncbi:MAG: NTP transferase domain-containing protein [Phycisphaeraceae bacterium JB051]